MRYAITSDLHANFEAFKAVLDDIDRREVDQIVCLGDVVGYNAKPNECAALCRERNIPTICGNHDAVACGMDEPWGFNPVALAAALWTRESLTQENTVWLRALPDVREFEHFLAVHGSPYDRDCYMFTWEDVLPFIAQLDESPYRVCFFGHTHSPGIFAADGVYTVGNGEAFTLEQGKSYFINPGSVGQPRDGNPKAAYGLYDTERRTYELIRVAYPVERAAQEIVDNELPKFLAERLFQGR